MLNRKGRRGLALRRDSERLYQNVKNDPVGARLREGNSGQNGKLSGIQYTSNRPLTGSRYISDDPATESSNDGYWRVLRERKSEPQPDLPGLATSVGTALTVCLAGAALAFIATSEEKSDQERRHE